MARLLDVLSALVDRGSTEGLLLERPEAATRAILRRVERRPLTSAMLAALAAALLLACGGGKQTVSAPAEPSQAKEVSTAADSHGHAERAERPLPAFAGWTLDGKRLEISSLIGRRLLIFFFNPETEDAAAVATAVSHISDLRTKENFQIVGVATGSDTEKARSFAKAHGIDYPVIDDSSANIASHLGLRFPVAVLGVDAEGYVVFGMAQFPTNDPNAVDAIESQLRTALRLPEAGARPALSERPMAPLFEAPILDAKTRFRLVEERGKPVVLVFFLHTCPHCHAFLEFMKKQLAAMDPAKRPVLVGVEVTGKTEAVRERMHELGLDFFPVLFDQDGKIRAEYGVFGGVPDIFLIDKQGRIVAHVQGWMPETDGPLLRMRMAKMSGAPVPMLLNAKGYSGNDVCSVCHESEHETWLITKHASAFDTLVKHGADSNPDCVKCHVVGFGKPGGYDLVARPRVLEDVGCEVCHGRGGPHQSPDFVKGGNYEHVCLTCHDTTHSLGFKYANFLPRISHAENAKILALPADQRRRVLAERGATRKDLLPTKAKYVGSEICASCHEKEMATWSAGPHARAMATLAADGKQSQAACQKCHTTAFDLPGGFDPGAPVSAQSDLARVGCESCHGPGGNHVVEGGKRIGTIVSLGDKCDSCVILQICGSCHDDANDPGFEFAVEHKIDLIRHGTTEAGTGKPLPKKDPAAAHGSHSAALPRLLSRAFAMADAREPAWSAR